VRAAALYRPWRVTTTIDQQTECGDTVIDDAIYQRVTATVADLGF